MSTIKVMVSQKGLTWKGVEGKIKHLFPKAGVNASVVKRATTRAERLAEAESLIEDAKSIVQELHDEIEQWKSGMEGTNLESTSKYEELDSCLTELQQLLDDLDSPDFSQISFPSMF